MVELLTFFKSLTTKKQRFWLYAIIASPLIASTILYMISSIFHLEIIDVRLKTYLILMWLASVIFFAPLFFLFCYFCIRNPDFERNKFKIKNSVLQLLENRLKKQRSFATFLSFSIICFYTLTLIPIITSFYRNNIFSSITAILPFLFLFLLFAKVLRNVFLGLRENVLSKYFIVLSLFSVWIIFYLFNLPIKFNKNFNLTSISTNIANWVIPVILTFIFALIIPILQKNLKKTYPKREVAGWEKSILSFDLISELVLSYSFLSFLFSLNLLLIVIDPQGVNTQIIIILIIFLYIGTFFINFIYLNHLTASFIKNIVKWDEFFKCFNGPVMKKLGENHQKLIKISGKCKAISIDEKYREKFDGFNQHFLLTIDDSEETVDVISLEEKVSFKDSIPLVREFGEIILIGELKYVLDDEILNPHENRISKLILAYHIEPKNKEINDK